MGFIGKSKQAKENEAELARLRQTVSSTTTDLNRAKEEIQRLQQQFEALHKEYQTSLQQNRNLSQQHNLLQYNSAVQQSGDAQRLKDLRCYADQLAEEKQSCQSLNQDLSKRLESALARSEQRAIEICQKEEVIQVLQQRLARIELGEKRVIGANATEEDILSIFQAQLDLRINEKQRTIREIEEQLRREQQRQSQLVEDLQNVRSRLHVEQLGRHDDEMAANVRLEALQEQVRSMQTQAENLERQRQELVNKDAVLQRRLRTTEGQMARLEDERAAAHEEISRIKEDVASLQHESVERSTQVEQARRELQEKDEQLVTTRGNLNQARNQLGIETRKAQRAVEEGKVKDRKIEFLQKQCVGMHLKLTSELQVLESQS